MSRFRIKSAVGKNFVIGTLVTCTLFHIARTQGTRGTLAYEDRVAGSVDNRPHTSWANQPADFILPLSGIRTYGATTVPCEQPADVPLHPDRIPQTKLEIDASFPCGTSIILIVTVGGAHKRFDTVVGWRTLPGSTWYSRCRCPCEKHFILSLLLNVGKHCEKRIVSRTGGTVPIVTVPVLYRVNCGWKRIVGIMEIMRRQTKLLHIIAALHPPCRFAGCLNCRQQESDQNTDDRNNDEKFNESKSSYIAPPLHLNVSVVFHNKTFLLLVRMNSNK
jgi:hypothetical protein